MRSLLHISLTAIQHIVSSIEKFLPDWLSQLAAHLKCKTFMYIATAIWVSTCFHVLASIFFMNTRRASFSLLFVVVPLAVYGIVELAIQVRAFILSRVPESGDIEDLAD